MSSFNHSLSSHNVSRSGRRVAFNLGGGDDGKADEDIFELLEYFKSIDRWDEQAVSILRPHISWES